jgi:4-diphosphocytidyl-2-C-methyl-D-erythritol kinase
MVKLLAEHAAAKINLCLRVTGKRADGYHQLDSIFLPIAWSDSVRLESRPSDEPRVNLICDNAAIADSTSNLASRAALAFMREYAIAAEILIDLRKHIPMGAGLGGGSSDAGAVLRMMAAIFGVPIDARLVGAAVKLGADVPFFLDPRPSRVRGIGEQIEPLSAMPRLHILVAVPSIEVPTVRVFRELKPENWSGALDASDLEAIFAGRISQQHLVNDLEAPAISLFPVVATLKALLKEEGAIAASMSGSGGAVFGIFSDASAANQAAARIRNRAPEAQVRDVVTTDCAELRGTSFSG